MTLGALCCLFKFFSCIPVIKARHEGREGLLKKSKHTSYTNITYVYVFLCTCNICILYVCLCACIYTLTVFTAWPLQGSAESIAQTFLKSAPMSMYTHVHTHRATIWAQQHTDRVNNVSFGIRPTVRAHSLLLHQWPST